MSCCLRPLPLKRRCSPVSVGACGAVATVSTVEPVTPARLAVTTEVPCARPVAVPVLEMVATEGVADAQVTCPVRSRVELSEKMPVAVNCCVAPTARLGLAGVTAIDWRVARADGDRTRHAARRTVPPVEAVDRAEVGECPRCREGVVERETGRVHAGVPGLRAPGHRCRTVDSLIPHPVDGIARLDRDGSG